MISMKEKGGHDPAKIPCGGEAEKAIIWQVSKFAIR